MTKQTETARKARQAQVKAEIADIDTQIQASEDAQIIAAGWTTEVTLARRDEWNAIVNSGAIISLDDKRRLESRLGWTHDDLKAALAYHGHHRRGSRAPAKQGGDTIMLKVNLNHEYWRPALADVIRQRAEAIPAEIVEAFITEVMREYARCGDYARTNFITRGPGVLQGGEPWEQHAFYDAYDAVVARWMADTSKIYPPDYRG